MPKQSFANLSIKQERYDHIRKNFESHVEKDTDSSFAKWVANTLDKNIAMWKIIKKEMPHLSLIENKGRKMILDSTSNKVIDVTYDKKANKIRCSEKEDADDYVRFAVFNPEYPLL